MTLPLNGLRVLEYGSGSGSGYCAALLADLGAHVDKIAVAPVNEVTPAGTLRRRATSVYLDSNKTFVDCEVGDDEFMRLVREAHIVVRGYDPAGGSPGELRNEYDRWHAENPDLVFVGTTPFGVVGPGSGWHGGDLNAQAISGWTWIVGNPGEAPLTMNYGIGALQQGLGAAGATLAALLERGLGSEGGGEFVDVSEADVIAACIRMYSLTYRFLNIELTRNGHRAPGSSGRYPHTILPCKDGFISTICRSPTDWGRFLDMIGNPAWGQEPRYQDFFKMGTEYPDEVDALIIPWLMEHTKAEIGELAVKHRVPLAPVNTVEEALANRQFEHRGFFRTHEVDGRKVRVPGMVAHWTRAE